MAKIAIVGAHGKVGQQLMRKLYDAGHDFVGILRGETEDEEDIYRLGGEGTLLDIERATTKQLAQAFKDAEAVVFTAGAGASSTIERKRSVDFEGSVKSQRAATLVGIRRFVQVSARGVDDPASLVDDSAEDGARWNAYVAAKRDADQALRESGLDWTIVRPTRLTFGEGTGLVTAATTVAADSTIPREDVAEALVAVLENPATVGFTFELATGQTPVAEAIAGLLG